MGEPERVSVDFVVTEEPWTLPADAIVVSVGGTYGELGQAVIARFPHAEWPTELDEITPGRPMSVMLGGRRAGEHNGLWLAILATPHGADTDPDVAAVERATETAVVMADVLGARSVVMPMLATGTLGMDLRSVAAVAVPAAIGATDNSNIQRIIFVTRSPSDVPILRAAWDGKLPKPTRLRPASRRQVVELAGGVSTDRVDPNGCTAPIDQCRGHQHLPLGAPSLAMPAAIPPRFQLSWKG